MRTVHLLLLPILLCLAPLPSYAADKALVLGIGEWPPYFSAALKENGVFAHIVTMAFAREGLSVRYDFYPWKRALLLAEHGKIDGSPGWVMTDERAQTLLFSDPVILSREVLFFRKEKPVEFNTLADLKGKVIGITLGYSYGDAFDKTVADGSLSTESASNDETNLRKLLAGRLDAVALNRGVGYHLLASKFSPVERARLVDSRQYLSEKQSRLAIGKALPGATALMASFNRGLAKLHQDGTIKRMLDAADRGDYESK
ncbi:substrate-binding periplasmic protein [Chitinimonas naiadis]